MRREWVTTKNR